MQQAKRASRRRHDTELKRQVLDACAQPGVSVAHVALVQTSSANAPLQHSSAASPISASRLHRGLRQRKCQDHVACFSRSILALLEATIASDCKSCCQDQGHSTNREHPGNRIRPFVHVLGSAVVRWTGTVRFVEGQIAKHSSTKNDGK